MQDLTQGFRFAFTNTVDDLLDAERAERAAEFSPATRWFAGIAVVGLAVVGWTLQKGSFFLFWVVLSLAGAWGWVIRPYRRRREIRRDSPASRRVVARFSEAGIATAAEGEEEVDRSWHELERLAEVPGGILLYFSEQGRLWLPRRLFGGADERAAFVEYVTGQLEASRAARESSIWHRRRRQVR